MKIKSFLTALSALGCITTMGNITVNAADHVDISQFIGSYVVDVDTDNPASYCEIRELEFTVDGQLQEYHGLAAPTTGTGRGYRFTDYQIVGNVLEGSYDCEYGYVSTDSGTSFTPLSDFSSGRHQMVLMDDGNIICDGEIWYRYES